MAHESLSDTRETVETEAKYLYFDMAIEPYLAGKCSLPTAIARYRLMSEGVVDVRLDPWRQDPPEAPQAA